MSDAGLPNEVCAFVRAHIPSVGHMEALVLTVEEHRHLWTAESVAGRLFVPEARACAILRDLATAGLLVHAADAGSWRFAPQTSIGDDLARRAVRLYRQCLRPMTSVIWSAAARGTV